MRCQLYGITFIYLRKRIQLFKRYIFRHDVDSETTVQHKCDNVDEITDTLFGWAVDEVLFWQWWKFTSLLKRLAFQWTGRGERPTWATLSL